ncbi:uncharacterized protein EI90DRAFT_3191144 [Cantharellus anzutake]|uniref:uncharacterized protein n=1 Tax=Cantharellus anzutake TaxID=1750568 RepID=UPI00190596FE|nr:uncharacterized protein EI90DRAFT_3191144 [Cantharellus anzutake]KAF8342838.1 hypothetical protein EI90DRAFT_3191144 [Cantharellus anzutake]
MADTIPPVITEAETNDAASVFLAEQTFSVPQTPGGALSRASSYAGPEFGPLQELVTTMKGTLDHLGGVFDTLGEQTARVASLAPALHTAHQIHQLRKQLVVQDRRQEERIQELKLLLRDVLKEQIATHLRVHVTRMIKEQIQSRVKDQVSKQLQLQFPEEMRIQVAQHRPQLAGVKRNLHDTNARRHNAHFKSHQLFEPLQPLHTANGKPSPDFPKDLATMFSVDAATAKKLCKDYELPLAPGGAADEREQNLNKFMAYCGMQFHMLPPPPRIQFNGLAFGA